MKAVIKSVSTEIFENIIYKKCSVLNSKTTPNCETPFKVYVYCSKAKNQWRFSDYEGAYENSKGEIVCAQQRVAAEFVCYSTANGWHISDLKIYDEPKKLNEFGQKCDNANEIRCRDCRLLEEWDNCCSVMCKPLTRAPSNWCYVEELPK